tara:strand:+ start:2973 stop:3725 length:753 start_codon:yes stop_codon:yes gene_type:complete
MKIDITLPTDLSEIPLLRYQKFIEMKEKSNDEEFIAQKMIQIFCGIELKEVMQIKLKDLNELINHFTTVFKQKPKLIRKFSIEKHEFAFIPNFENISFGEYVDIEHNLQNWTTYHKAMAVMYRPVKEQYKDKYSIVDYEPNEDMQELMKFAPLDVALSASFFLQNLGAELLNATTVYLQQELKKMTASTNTQNETNSVRNGDGILQSINVLKEMSPDLMKLHAHDLLNVSRISRSRKKKTKLKTEKLKDK